MSFADKFKEKIKEQTKKVEGLIASSSLVEERVSTCNGCEHLFKPSRQCKKCGCFIDAKARLKNAECPIKKW